MFVRQIALSLIEHFWKKLRTTSRSNRRSRFLENGFHIAAELFLLICAVALLLILFVLLKPVSRDLALLAVLFNLVSIGLEAAITLYLVEALFPLGNARYNHLVALRLK